MGELIGIAALVLGAFGTATIYDRYKRQKKERAAGPLHQTLTFARPYDSSYFAPGWYWNRGLQYWNGYRWTAPAYAVGMQMPLYAKRRNNGALVAWIFTALTVGLHASVGCGRDAPSIEYHSSRANHYFPRMDRDRVDRGVGHGTNETSLVSAP